MKKLIALFIVILVIILSSCGNSNTAAVNSPSTETSEEISEPINSPSAQTSEEISEPINSPSAQTSEEITESFSTEADKAIHYYKDVMQNNIKLTLSDFVGTEEYQPIYLNQLINYIYEDSASYFHFGKFAIIDIDEDNIPVIVIEVDDSYGSFDHHEVLHYFNDNVYVYDFEARWMQELKKDGTFYSSESAADTTFEKISFIENKLCFDTLAYSEEASEDEDGYPIINYYISDKPVTEDAFYLYWDQFDAKEYVTWYDFDENNITEYLNK